jgi:hypothetical protein
LPQNLFFLATIEIATALACRPLTSPFVLVRTGGFFWGSDHSTCQGGRLLVTEFGRRVVPTQAWTSSNQKTTF